MAHAPLITRADLLRYGISGEFLAQFDLRPVEVAVDAAGALGTAAVKWRWLGEETYSPAIASSSRAPWLWSPAGSFAVLTFAAGTYVLDSVYTIDEDGTITRTGGAIATVTATRFDVVEDKIAEKTARALSLMRPRKEPAITSWGADVRGAVAAMVRYGLKDYVGFAPSAAAVGDAQIVTENERAEEFLARIGTGQELPPDMVDSSADGAGAGLMVRATGADSRGW